MELGPLKMPLSKMYDGADMWGRVVWGFLEMEMRVILAILVALLQKIVEWQASSLLFCKTKETEVPGMPQVFVSAGAVGIVELAIDYQQYHRSWAAVGSVKRAQSWWEKFECCFWRPVNGESVLSSLLIELLL
jgi:hypothetical protein